MENVKNNNSQIVESVELGANLERWQANRFGIRHLQVTLLFTGLLIAYGLRVNLSVGIVAMVDNSSSPNIQHFDWKESTQGIILSSFFWGYVLSQIPAGPLSQRYGAKILLLVSSIISTILTLLTPYAAYLGWQWLCATRIIQGISQGVIFPSVHTLLAKWVHPSERAFLVAFTYSGTQIGTVFMLGISGIIASSTAGWPSIFYISGALSFVWTICWYFYGSNSPAINQLISQMERNYLMESMVGNPIVDNSASSSSSSSSSSIIPWKDILMSKPFLAIVIAHMSQNWGFWTLLTEIPSYMKNVLNFDIKSNALLSALPYLVMWILSICMSRISDHLVNNGHMSIGNSRKIFNSIGSYIPMICLIGLGYTTQENNTMAIVLLTLGVGINSGTYVGYMVNHMDLSPNYAGTLMGITNCAANVMSILGPLFAGFIITKASDPAFWRIVFFVTSGFFFFGNTIFVIFGRGKIQYWNSQNNENNKQIGNSTNTIETLDIADVPKSK